jgi:hypothetical protein
MYSRGFRRRHNLTGFVSEEFREKEENLLLGVQWFSGFQECSSALRGQRSTIQTLWILDETGGRTQQVGGGGIRKVWLGNGNKRRESVMRLIKLLYQSNFRIYKFKIYFQ